MCYWRDSTENPRDRNQGSGAETAALNFRNFAFVSGILLARELAQKHATEKWDGSEMYQTFLATRIIAEGGRLLGVADAIAAKSIQIPGKTSTAI